MPSQIKQELSQQTEELVMWISVVRRSALVVFALLLPGSLVAQQYHRTDLTVDMQAVSPSAPNVDSNLVNAWGLSRGSGSPWWISDNGTGLSTLYNAAGEIGRASCRERGVRSGGGVAVVVRYL